MQLPADRHQCPVYSLRTVTRHNDPAGLSYRWLFYRSGLPAARCSFGTISGTHGLFQDYLCGAKHAITTEGPLPL
jgi:hypothetical protein